MRERECSNTGFGQWCFGLVKKVTGLLNLHGRRAHAECVSVCKIVEFYYDLFRACARVGV